MTKFKLRLFHSCRSKDPSTLPNHPVPVFQRHHNIFTPTTTTTEPPPPPSKHHQQQPHRSSFKSHVSSAFGCGSKSGNHSDSDFYFQWQEDDQWHVVAKIYDVESPRRKIYNSSVSEADTDDDRFPLQLPLLPLEKKKRRRCRKVKLRHNNISTSSGEEVIDDDTETETLISSSRSFSTDTSTDFNPQLETIRESAPVSYKLIKKKKKKREMILSKQSKGRVINCGGGMTSPEWGSPARLSVFKKMIPCKLVEGKMKESFAVVKRSANPYDDFKRSMMEMILEKQMFTASDLEQLLQCFLSLNSRFHHGVIVEAFSEIWDTVFGNHVDAHDLSC